MLNIINVRTLPLMVCIGLFSTGTGCASTSPGDMTTKRFDEWLVSLCKQARCQPQEVRSLIPYYFETTPGASKALKMNSNGQIYYLLHNYNQYAPDKLKIIAFLPEKLGKTWTIDQLETVSKWMVQLAGGKLNVQRMQQCITALKSTGYPQRRLGEYGDPQRLNALFINGQPIATGDCWWLPHKKGVAFGFMGQW